MPANASDVHFFIAPIESFMSYDGYREYAIQRPFLPAIGILIYLIILYTGRKVMRDRKPLDLKLLLFLWNTSLSLFSIVSTIRFTSILLYRYRSYDRQDFFCSTEADDVSGFWYMLFVYSKFLEFGDTFFLIVRKRRIMFLHWYHHITVLVMAWLVFVEKAAVGPFFGSVNVFIHSLMYTYYALQTIGIKLPQFLSMALTLMQTMQMLIGLAVIRQVHRYSQTERGCNSSSTIIGYGSLMYASYFLLFARFFVHSYISRPTESISEDMNHNHSKSD